MKIVINTRVLDFYGSQISYEKVVQLAGMTGHPSVTYRGPRNGDSQRSGIMHPGCKAVELDEGMVFNAQHTGNA